MCGCKSKKMGISNWWLSSLNNYNGSNSNIYNSTISNTFAFRPSINLKASVLVGAGDGTVNNASIVG